MDQVRRAEPDGQADLPPRARAERVEFIEFTADRNEVNTLEAMLRSLGFSPAGRHVSKQVSLWRQGAINLVINTEEEGFVHSAYVMHGTSVCDIGLLVGDARAAMERAQALGANVFSRKRGKNELDVPAVRGVGGPVLHFLDRRSELSAVWDKEFRGAGTDGAGTGEDAGLTPCRSYRPDHEP